MLQNQSQGSSYKLECCSLKSWLKIMVTIITCTRAGLSQGQVLNWHACQSSSSDADSLTKPSSFQLFHVTHFGHVSQCVVDTPTGCHTPIAPCTHYHSIHHLCTAAASNTVAPTPYNKLGPSTSPTVSLTAAQECFVSQRSIIYKHRPQVPPKVAYITAVRRLVPYAPP